MSKQTEITVVGNVVGPPQRNRTPSGSVTNFRIASTAQRFDKDLQRWVDKKPLFLDVECWGELGGNVSHSVSKGDPVVVVGELFTHEWDTDQGRRSKTRLRAEAVGLDLMRGTAEFKRSRRERAEPDDFVPAAPGPAIDGEPADGVLEDVADGVPDDVEEVEFRLGKDYVLGPETLDDVDSEQTVREPALR